MQCCASCGQADDVRLWEVEDGDRFDRVWWCSACSAWARSLGIPADLSPVWIERAALHQLPTKPLETSRPEFTMIRTGRRWSDVRVRSS